MSAFTLPDNHISAIIGYAVRHNAIGYAMFAIDMHYDRNPSPEQLREIGQILLDENYRSVNTRYREEEQTPRFIYNPRFENGKCLTHKQVINAIRCYDYQSCETNDYNSSPAAKFVSSIKNSAVERLVRDDPTWVVD